MHKPDGLLVLGFLQARDRFYWPRAPDHQLISKTGLSIFYDSVSISMPVYLFFYDSVSIFVSIFMTVYLFLYLFL
jgi:hypothetical protein